MSAPDLPHLAGFVAAVHRRLLLLRILEGMGLGVLGACGVLLALMPILAARGASPLPAIAPLLAIGAMGGFVWAILRRSTRLSAAMEADRQLDLRDLLSSAWVEQSCGPGFSLLQNSSLSPAPQAMRDAMLAMAERRCAGLSPGALVLNRLGARTWGGIGLATALVVTVGLLVADPLPTRAVAGGGVLATATGISPADASTVLALPRIGSSANPGDPNESSLRGGGDEAALDWMRSADAQQPDMNDAALTRSAGGSGMAFDQSQTQSGNPLSAGGTQARSAGGDATLGGTGAGAIDPRAGTPAGARTGEDRGQRPPAWAAPTWPAAAAAAIQSAEARQIPADYREMVREYFSRGER